jgi:hypothetical protein
MPRAADAPRRLIEEEDLGLAHELDGDGQPLALLETEAGARRADNGIL